MECARQADAKKCRDIRVLCITDLLPLTDYFVLVTGDNRRQLQAVCDDLSAAVKTRGRAGPPMEGHREGNWICLDLGEVVVHLMRPEHREFYDLDGLWGDAPEVVWQEHVAAAGEKAR